MAELKTKPNDNSVATYLADINDEGQRADAEQLVKIISEITGEKPMMWGNSIVGFGLYHYKYASGREGDWMKIGFSARKTALTIYGLVFYDKMAENNELLESLGKHKNGKGCLYIKTLSDIDLDVLKQMVKNAYSPK